MGIIFGWKQCPRDHADDQQHDDDWTVLKGDIWLDELGAADDGGGKSWQEACPRRSNPRCR